MLAAVSRSAQTLSIIVVSLNEADTIGHFAESVRRLRNPDNIPLEVILVDGGSTDGTAQRARNAGFAKVLELPGASIPVCRNRGAAEASGQWLAYVDADCELAEDWLEQAAPFLREHGEIILGWPAEPPEPPTWVQAAWKIHWARKNPHTELLDGKHIIRKQGFRLVTTRNMLLTRLVFDRLGGFDEELTTGEDTDLVFRAYLQGIPVLGVPALRVVHRGEPATLGAFFRQQLWHANRRSYRKIVKKKGARIGGNAPLYTVLFMIGLLLFLAGLGGAAAGYARAAIFLIPLPALVIFPAILIAGRERNLKLVLPLSALYAAYGFARVLDLLGFSGGKTNWKQT